MEVLFIIFASLAALLHSYIFVLETFLWTKPAAKKVFGLTESQAHATKELAANQGVYNGALAGIVFTGIIIVLTGDSLVGRTLIVAGVMVMLIAAVYLFASAPTKRAAAVKQGIFPLATTIIAILTSF